MLAPSARAVPSPSPAISLLSATFNRPQASVPLKP